MSFFSSFPLYQPGLPIQVRDAGLSFKDDMPKSDVNKEYYTQNMEREVCCRFLDAVLYLIRELVAWHRLYNLSFEFVIPV